MVAIHRSRFRHLSDSSSDTGYIIGLVIACVVMALLCVVCYWVLFKTPQTNKSLLTTGDKKKKHLTSRFANSKDTEAQKEKQQSKPLPVFKSAGPESKTDEPKFASETILPATGRILNLATSTEPQPVAKVQSKTPTEIRPVTSSPSTTPVTASAPANTKDNAVVVATAAAASVTAASSVVPNKKQNEEPPNNINTASQSKDAPVVIASTPLATSTQTATVAAVPAESQVAAVKAEALKSNVVTISSPAPEPQRVLDPLAPLTFSKSSTIAPIASSGQQPTGSMDIFAPIDYNRKPVWSSSASGPTAAAAAVTPKESKPEPEQSKPIAQPTIVPSNTSSVDKPAPVNEIKPAPTTVAKSAAVETQHAPVSVATSQPAAVAEKAVEPSKAAAIVTEVNDLRSQLQQMESQLMLARSRGSRNTSK